MPVPTHAPGCRTRLFPTPCPDCAETVYYFDCTCGSKVFFDAPGHPWPLHQDRCLPYLIRRLRDVERLPYDAIRQRVRLAAAERDRDVPIGVLKLIAQLERKGRQPETVLDVKPYDGAVDFEGEVVGCNLEVNYFKRFKYMDSQVTRALLGALVRRPHVEVMVRGPRDVESGCITQFTFFVSRDTYQRAGIRVGARVGIALHAQRLPNGTMLWIGEDIYRLP